VVKRLYYRRYKDVKGKHLLSTWIQRRCKVCGKFIGGVKQFLCTDCYKDSYEECMVIKRNVEKYGMDSVREFINIEIPRKLRDNLRTYT
jgi:hypothetical protein